LDYNLNLSCTHSGADLLLHRVDLHFAMQAAHMRLWGYVVRMVVPVGMGFQDLPSHRDLLARPAHLGHAVNPDPLAHPVPRAHQEAVTFPVTLSYCSQ